MAESVLLPHDLESSVWKKIKSHLEAELASLREYNDGESLDAVKTAAIRGEIKRIKRVLKLGAPNEKRAGG